MSFCEPTHPTPGSQVFGGRTLFRRHTRVQPPPRHRKEGPPFHVSVPIPGFRPSGGRVSSNRCPSDPSAGSVTGRGLPGPARPGHPTSRTLRVLVPPVVGDPRPVGSESEPVTGSR